jgi:GNAT superfamily N-acetyltransferase
MQIRPLRRDDVVAAARVLLDAYTRMGQRHGYAPPWAGVDEAAAAASRDLADEPEGSLVVEDDGTIVGVGFVRRRGEAATVGPIATAAWGRGLGGKLLDELVGRAEGWGCQAIRLYQEGANPTSFAMFAGRSFAPVDVVACVERAPGKNPPGGSRGLDITPFRPGDLEEIAALDTRLTGLERGADLRALVALVARRRGAVVAFLGRSGGALGPAVALDAADLGTVLQRSLDGDQPLRARLSTAAPAALLMAGALGFKVTSLGTVMVRGPAPPARPPQLYSIVPEVL